MRFPQPQTDWSDRGTHRWGWCHGDPWPAERMGSGMRAVARANNPLCLSCCPQARHRTATQQSMYCVSVSLHRPGLLLLARSVACKLISSCHPCSLILVVGGPRIERSAVHRNVAHFVCAPVLWEAISLPPSFSWAPSQAPCWARPSQSRPFCKRRFCLWSHPSRGRRRSVGLVVRPLRWLELRIQRVTSVCSPEDP